MAAETEPDLRIGKSREKSKYKRKVLDGDQGTGHPLTDDSFKHEDRKCINTSNPVSLGRI